jgi:hypothetical protein
MKNEIVYFTQVLLWKIMHNHFIQIWLMEFFWPATISILCIIFQLETFSFPCWDHFHQYIFVIIGFAFAYAFEICCSEKVYIPRMHGFAICFYVVMSLVFQWFLFWSTYSVFSHFHFFCIYFNGPPTLFFSHFLFHLHLFNHWYIMFLRSWLILLYEVIVFLF